MTNNLVGDLLDRELYRNGTPHEVFAKLRRECPVYWNPPKDGHRGFWNITKWADIAECSRDVTHFSSHDASVQENAQVAMSDRILIMMDPPRHTDLRNSIRVAFNPKTLATLEPVVRHYVTRTINDVIEKGECDFFDIAATQPVRMISHLLGVPEDMQLQVLEWTNATFGQDDPEFAATPEVTFAAFLAMQEYGHALIKEREQNPRNDLISLLINARIGGQPLSREELGWNFFLFLGAGNETTRTLLLNSLNTLFTYPDAFEEVKADTKLLPLCIEEILRHEPSVRNMGRIVTEDVVVRGTQIRKGEHVALWYVSGCRDEEVFENPNAFDFRRPNLARHQAFGYGGPHFCMGAPLARLQAKIIFEELFKRMPDIERAGPIVRQESTGFMNSIKSIPIRFTPGKQLPPPPLPPMF